jgi:hypothetical protein
MLGIVSDADDDGEAARKAAQYAKSTTSEYKSPEEPARSVTDEPISNLSAIKAKQAFRDKNKGLTPAALLKNYEEFCQATIQKSEPTTEQDAQALLIQLAEMGSK